MMRWIAPVCMAACLALPASAQVGVTLPGVPDVGGVLGRLPEDPLDVGALRDARALRVQDLLRRHRRELEADPAGQPIVRSQIIALGADAAALERAERAGFEVVRRDALGEAGEMVTLRAPARMSTRRALRMLREADLQGVYDFDHLHLESAGDQEGPPQPPSQAGDARVGLVDGGVGASARVAAQRSFAGDSPVASAHGEATAALLLAAAPRARLYAADIYGGAPTGGASSALARALAWLASERVAVINVSLVGPRNRIVEAIVARLVARGHLIVAAVGNDGPAAAPLYPSAYPGVVGVTGVDSRGRVLVEAGRGPQVDFAALGLHRAHLRGTSYAAPIVAGRLAGRLAEPDAAQAESAIAALRAEARDLGSRGRDDVYGYGLIDAAP